MLAQYNNRIIKNRQGARPANPVLSGRSGEIATTLTIVTLLLMAFGMLIGKTALELSQNPTTKATERKKLGCGTPCTRSDVGRKNGPKVSGITLTCTAKAEICSSPSTQYVWWSPMGSDVCSSDYDAICKNNQQPTAQVSGTVTPSPTTIFTPTPTPLNLTGIVMPSSPATPTSTPQVNIIQSCFKPCSQTLGQDNPCPSPLECRPRPCPPGKPCPAGFACLPPANQKSLCNNVEQTPTPTLRPDQVVRQICPFITNTVPQTVITDALDNPSLYEGGNDPTNIWLSLKKPNSVYNSINNPVVFVSVCPQRSCRLNLISQVTTSNRNSPQLINMKWSYHAQSNNKTGPTDTLTTGRTSYPTISNALEGVGPFAIGDQISWKLNQYDSIKYTLKGNNVRVCQYDNNPDPSVCTPIDGVPQDSPKTSGDLTTTNTAELGCERKIIAGWWFDQAPTPTPGVGQVEVATFFSENRSTDNCRMGRSEEDSAISLRSAAIKKGSPISYYYGTGCTITLTGKDNGFSQTVSKSKREPCSHLFTNVPFGRYEVALGVQHEALVQTAKQCTKQEMAPPYYQMDDVVVERQTDPYDSGRNKSYTAVLLEPSNTCILETTITEKACTCKGAIINGECQGGQETGSTVIGLRSGGAALCCHKAETGQGRSGGAGCWCTNKAQCERENTPNSPKVWTGEQGYCDQSGGKVGDGLCCTVGSTPTDDQRGGGGGSGPAVVCPKGNAGQAGQSCNKISKCNIQGGCDPACCAENSDCPTGQSCSISNGNCRSGKSCAQAGQGVTPTPGPGTPPSCTSRAIGGICASNTDSRTTRGLDCFDGQQLGCGRESVCCVNRAGLPKCANETNCTSSQPVEGSFSCRNSSGSVSWCCPQGQLLKNNRCTNTSQQSESKECSTAGGICTETNLCSIENNLRSIGTRGCKNGRVCCVSQDSPNAPTSTPRPTPTNTPGQNPPSLPSCILPTYCQNNPGSGLRNCKNAAGASQYCCPKANQSYANGRCIDQPNTPNDVPPEIKRELDRLLNNARSACSLLPNLTFNVNEFQIKCSTEWAIGTKENYYQIKCSNISDFKFSMVGPNIQACMDAIEIYVEKINELIRKGVIKISLITAGCINDLQSLGDDWKQFNQAMLITNVRGQTFDARDRCFNITACWQSNPISGLLECGAALNEQNYACSQMVIAYKDRTPPLVTAASNAVSSCLDRFMPLAANIEIENSSNKEIKKVEITVCDNTDRCETKTSNVSVPNGKNITIKEIVPTIDGELVTESKQYNVSCNLTYADGSTAKCPSKEVKSSGVQMKLETLPSGQVTGTVFSTLELTDCDNDKKITTLDYSILANQYDRIYPTCDPNRNGQVDALDISTTIALFDKDVE